MQETVELDGSDYRGALICKSMIILQGRLSALQQQFQH
jgi:hypothetical protein